MPLRRPVDAYFTTFLVSLYLAAFSGNRSDPRVGAWKEDHSSELPIQIRDDLPYSLGGVSRSGDDIWRSPSATKSELPRGTVHCFLGGSDGMACGHVFLHDARVVTDDLDQKSQAVGGAGGITDNLEGVVILFMVHVHHKHGGIIRRGRDDDCLGPTLQVIPSLLHSGEDPSGFHNLLNTSITPFVVGRVSLLEDGMGFPLMTSFPLSALTVPLNLLWVD